MISLSLAVFGHSNLARANKQCSELLHFNIPNTYKLRCRTKTRPQNSEVLETSKVHVSVNTDLFILSAEV